MNDTYLTIVGNVVEDPKLRTTKSGVQVTSLRLASTSRRFDRETAEWKDNERLFVTVTCWRGTAVNVARSLRKGQPVVVTGRYYCREYRKDDVNRASYELEAVAIGHDLSRGVSTFTKGTFFYPTTSVELDDDGVPPDLSHEGRDLTGDRTLVGAEDRPLVAVG
jgi:single-strand DNA-binding protein